MNTKTLQTLSDKQGRLKNSQSGMTLVEVLISMFVLAIGVLALLSVQLRAVSGVREAESQTIVSQITQNMIENMLINPKFVQSAPAKTNAAGHIGKQEIKKSYNHYLVNSTSMTISGAYKDSMNKDELAAAQISEFDRSLKSVLGTTTKYFFAICRDSSGNAPTYTSNSFHANCDNNGDTLIKVLWLADAEEKAASALNSSGNFIVYTHQSRVTE